MSNANANRPSPRRSSRTGRPGSASRASGTIDLKILPGTVQQQAVEQLRSAILAGVFKPGDRLVEAALCDRLGVSRPSIREALRSLEAERLISIIPNRGPQIPVLTWQEAAEIYQVRALLEGEAAALAAHNSLRKDHDALRAALRAFGKAVRSQDEAARLTSTTAFYGELLRLCGNRLIEEMLQSLHARINVLRQRSMSLPGRAMHSLEEMKAILDAVECGNRSAARAAAVRHVRQALLAAKSTYDVSSGIESDAE